MRIIITGKPKEIAALAAETQERQFQQTIAMQMHYETDNFNAMCKGIKILREVQGGALDEPERIVAKGANGKRITLR